MPFFLLLLLYFAMPAAAQTQWFDRHSEGWFWYELVQDSEAEQEEPPKPSAIAEGQPLTTAWIRKNIGQYLDTAIDHPSKENVSNYLYLDRLVKEKAERFAHIGKQVIESDPMLDENVRRPISPAAAKIQDEMAFQAKEFVLKKTAKKAGLVFYYQGNCKLCQLQSKTVQILKELYGFNLISVSTDGVLMPELPESRAVKKPPPALNIKTYPSLFLLKPPNNILLLRQGVMSFTELVDRMVQAAYEYQLISESEYQATRTSKEVWITPKGKSFNFPNSKAYTVTQ